MRRLSRLFGLLGGACTICIGQAAFAQNYDPFLDSEIPFDISRGHNVSVVDRERPEYDPLGVRLASLLVYPSAQLGVGYSTNVFGSANNPTSDAFFAFDPRLTVQSDWSRHAAGFHASGAFRRFAEATLKNENGFSVGTDGRLDVGPSSYLNASIGGTRDYEAQYSGSFPQNAARSVEYFRKNAMFRATYQGARLKIIGSTDITDFNFRDTQLLNGAVLDQDFRDRTIYRGSGRVELALSPDTAGFVQATYSSIGYKRPLTTGGNRDGHEFRVLGGATLDLTALIRGSIGLGYVRRDYDSPAFKSFGGLSADIRLQYFPSQITTVTLSAQRKIEDSILANSSGYFVNAVSLSVDHELLRNLLLNAEFDYQRNVFQTVTRRDQMFRVTGGARYLINRSLTLSANTTYFDRTSSGLPTGQQFDEWRGTLSLTISL